MALTDPVTVLKGVGASRAAQLEKLRIVTLEDLIHYYPRDYEDRTKLVTLSQLTTEEPACFRAMVLSTPRTSYVRRGLTYTRCTISDDTARLRITWFNQPWMSQNLVRGTEYYFYGSLSGDDRKYELVNPVVEQIEAPPTATRCIIPVYTLTKGLTSRMLQSLIFAAMERCQGELTDRLPAGVLEHEQLMPLYPALIEVHHPTTTEALSKARQRLIFEEFFLYSLGVGLMKARRGQESH